MTLSLKRKRSDPATPRKLRKYEDEEQSGSSDSGQSEHDSMEGDSSGAEEEESDEEEWTGTGVTIPPSQSDHSGKPNKPPTGEELRIIRDATDLFRSNSFKLQIDALLPNVRPKASRIPPLERFLLALHTYIMEIPSITPQHPLEASRKLLKKGVTVPYTLPLPTEETKWKVGYESPNDITLVGSWPNKVSVKPIDGLRYGVDLAVEMPDSLFQEKDYLNGRFFQKRAFYLAAIATALRSSKSKLNIDVYYHSSSVDPRSTNLVLIPKRDDSQLDYTKLNAQVVIIPTVSQTCPMPSNRLSPSHSNLRLSSPTSQQEESEQSQPRYVPSPTYNTAILRSFTPRLHLLSTHNLKSEAPAFNDAVTLLRVWANQRGFTEGGEDKLCVCGFEGRGALWSAIVSLVILGEEQRPGNASGIFGKRRPLGRGLSSYQIFKASLDFLAKFEFEKEAVFVKCATSHRFPPEEYDTRQQAVFVDSTSLLNQASGIPCGALELLRSEALQTLETLSRTAIPGDSFDEVFLKDHRNLPTRFDSILRVDLSNAKPRRQLIDETMDKGSVFGALLGSIDALLHKGLSDRTKVITILHSSVSPRTLYQAFPDTPEVIYIGLVYHPQNATRLVDHGPAADEQDQTLIAAFRELWGDKSELRRFKDGRILESVVWDVKTAEERAHVPTFIVQFLLERHFGIVSSSTNSIKAVQGWHTAFDSVLRLPEDVSKVYLNGGLPVGYKNAMKAFDDLVKAIKALDDELPLATLNVSPICEALRYTSIFSPVPLPDSLASVLPPNARYLPHMDLIIEFEKSSKWPDDLKAIQKIKLAFFERLAEGLMKTLQGSKARIIIGDGVHQHNPILDQSCLEVVTPEGWAFAIRIWNPREAVLLDRIIAGHDKVLPHVKPLNQQKQQNGKDYRDAVLAKEVYTRRFIHAPRHHRIIATLCHRYSAYAGTVRLAKRWLSAHWLLGPGYVNEETVELVCAKVFVGDDGKYVSMDVDSDAAIRQPGIPGTKERGFSRVVEFLKEWKWEEGIHVPISASSQNQQVYSEEEADSGNRDGGKAESSTKGISGEAKKDIKASTSSAWTIMTEFDKEGKVWTRHGPDVVVAHRIKALARATWEYLQGIEKGNMDVKALFVHPTGDYDFIIQLNPTVLPRYAHNITANPDAFSRKGKYANQILDGQGVSVRPSFDPARMFFDDLQRIYADTFKIFYDVCGGDRFGVVWDPSVKQPKPFRVLGGFSSKPVNKNNKEKGKNKDSVSLNETAILGEIERMGEGLIAKIVTRT